MLRIKVWCCATRTGGDQVQYMKYSMRGSTVRKSLLSAQDPRMSYTSAINHIRCMDRLQETSDSSAIG